MPSSLIGSHVREARIRLGRTQAALAREVGISAAYLNLIEHNRRRIKPDILGRIAVALDVEVDTLAAGGNPAVISDLRAISAADPNAAANPDTAEAFVSRFPGWAQLLVGLDRRIRDQEQIIAALADRLTHDPFLSENIHAMLSNITAIRSTASILAQVDDMPDAQRRQFHRGVHEESLRLSDAASQIAEYLGKAATRPGEAVTAEEALDQFLTAARFCFDPLDREADALTDLPRDVALQRLGSVAASILDAAKPTLDGAARRLAQSYLAEYSRDALAMPLRPFHAAAAELKYDPFALSDRFAQPIHAVLRRLAVLDRPSLDAPSFGLISVTASGYPLFRKPLPQFALPRHGNACPLWPLYAALSRPGQPILARIGHDSGAVFTALAVSGPRQRPDLTGPPDTISSMLVMADGTNVPFAHAIHDRVEVGTSCRICTRSGCRGRIEPYLLAEQEP